LGFSRAARLAVIAFAIVASYVLGSIPFGLLVVRAASGKDVRAVGSGNIGATNVARAAGRSAAATTLALDALKGFAPAFLAARELPAPWAPAACGIAAVLGHCYPVWLRFRGGKGVATGLGVALALAPWAALCGAAVWMFLYKLLRISSVGSLAGVAAALLVSAATAPRWSIVAVAAVAAIVVVRHRGNVERLLRHHEH
jgi:acyl phosphate:glycerol-3-phosphate acyltransferase